MPAPQRGSPSPRRLRQARHRTPRGGRARPRRRVPLTGRPSRREARRRLALLPWPGLGRWSRPSRALSAMPRLRLLHRRSWHETRRNLGRAARGRPVVLPGPEIPPQGLPPGAFHVRVVRLGEAELAVQAVGVAGMQGPAEAGARAAVDHGRYQLLAQARAARVGKDEDVRQVGEGHIVRDGAGEADLAAGGRLVRADDAPRGGKLLLEVRPRAEPAPVRLRGQELPDRVPVDPALIVVKLVHAGGEDHRRIVGRGRWLTGPPPASLIGLRRPAAEAGGRRATEEWMIDELAHAGAEHLDEGFIAGFDRKQGHPDPETDIAAFAAHGLGRASAVVDFGAGTGQFAIPAARRFGRVTAVDVSPGMLAALAAKAAASPALECARGGFLSYFPARPVDGVYTRHALHQLPDFWKAIALRRIADMLRPGGVLRLRDLVYDFGPGEAGAVFDGWLAGAAEDPAAGYTAADYAEHIRTEHSTFRWLLEPMIAAAGLDIAEVSYDRRLYAAYTCVKAARG